MPNESFQYTLPDGSARNDNLIFLSDQHNAGFLYYLQAVRSFVGPSLAAKLDGMRVPYENMEALCTAQLAGMIQGPFDAVASPPSDHRFPSAYRLPIREQLPMASDITDRFDRAPGVKAGSNDTRMEDIHAALSYQSQGDEKGWKSLLIVDDVLATGKTVAAMVARLQEAGLRQEATITVACPLRIMAPKRAPDEP